MSISQACDESVPILLVGTKSDLASEFRAVEKEMAEQLVINNNLAGYVETSALKGDNVELAFQTIVDEVYSRQFAPSLLSDIPEIQVSSPMHAHQQSSSLRWSSGREISFKLGRDSIETYKRRL